jgi:hypothetical protein
MLIFGVTAGGGPRAIDGGAPDGGGNVRCGALLAVVVVVAVVVAAVTVALGSRLMVTGGFVAVEGIGAAAATAAAVKRCEAAATLPVRVADGAARVGTGAATFVTTAGEGIVTGV